jgi:signal transduction histidine kinase
MVGTGREDRLRQLVRAGIALGGEATLDDLLRRLVETAASLTGARYAALGVLAPEGRTLERFITVGIDSKTEAEIGELPTGRGILGVLIGDTRPLRLDDLMSDARSVGFPLGHPPMHGFLGVPIMLRGSAYGNLYLTEKDGEESFTDDDEDIVTLLAGQAAVAIENARLLEASRRWARQLESLAEVADALAGEVELSRLLGLIVSRMRQVVGCRLGVILLKRPDGTLRVEAAEGEGAELAGDASIPFETSKAGRVMERRRSERVDSILDDPEFDGPSIRRLEARAALVVPLVVRDQAIGALVAYDRETRDARFSDTDLRVAETFASRASVAIDLSRRVAHDSLQAALRAQEKERRRLARELHDETGQALTAILLGLGTVSRAVDPEARARAVGELRDLASAALEDVRSLAFDLRPKVLDDFGLEAALRRLVERTMMMGGLRVEIEVALPARLGGDIETAVYRMVQEALTNAIKHAAATRVAISVQQRDDEVSILVEDDGAGFDPERVSSDRYGLTAMRDRLALLGGRFSLSSAPGAGVTLQATIPLPHSEHLGSGPYTDVDAAGGASDRATAAAGRSTHAGPVPVLGDVVA